MPRYSRRRYYGRAPAAAHAPRSRNHARRGRSQHRAYGGGCASTQPSVAAASLAPRAGHREPAEPGAGGRPASDHGRGRASGGSVARLGRSASGRCCDTGATRPRGGRRGGSFARVVSGHEHSRSPAPTVASVRRGQPGHRRLSRDGRPLAQHDARDDWTHDETTRRGGGGARASPV